MESTPTATIRNTTSSLDGPERIQTTIEAQQHQKGTSEKVGPSTGIMSKPIVWYCPSRWLMAHHDSQANIHTMSSHMCLADLNNDGENLLALIDFKQPHFQQQQQQHQRQPGSQSGSSSNNNNNFQLAGPQPPYDCRLRVYRGQQLIYNHFLDDMPSCMIATSIRSSPSETSTIVANSSGSFRQAEQAAGNQQTMDRPLLTIAINDDVYFYHKLKPSHRISLEDDECIIDTLNKSEYDTWQMVRQNKVDVETMRELLVSLSNELGNEGLTSHSNNFLALDTNEERKNYLLLWKFKRLNNGLGEHIMSMDTICCAAARLKFTSNVTRSGDFGQTRETGTFLHNSRWNRILDIQKNGLLLGTEDRHLLIYELRLTRGHLESHYRLPSTLDHILVERRSPASFELRSDLNSLTYKILISCRNCRIYSIDQNYLVPNKQSRAQVKELLALKCNVLDMCWTGDEAAIVDGISQPNFVVACLDRRVYCFSSQNGQCKWVIEIELPVTCLVSLPISRVDSNDSSSLIGVASQANRIDFYVSLTGRIVDSIYFGNDYCQAMTFGRFGREDNCLCLTTKLGHLLIFILKRTAKFAHGQCLSSAASHASDALSICSQNHHQVVSQSFEVSSTTMNSNNKKQQQHMMKQLNEPPSLPSAFSLTKSLSVNPIDQALDLLQSEHNCDQVLAKSSLDAHLVAPQLQVPVKSRDFVDHIVDQSRNSTAVSRVFAKHMVKLRDKIRSTIEQQCDLRLDSNREDGNRITLLRITGLGNTYRVSLSLRLNLKRYAQQRRRRRRHHLLSGPAEEQEQVKMKQLTSDEEILDSNAATLIGGGEQHMVSVFVFVANKQRQCKVKPFRFELAADGCETEQPQPPSGEEKTEEGKGEGGGYLAKKQQWILEKTIEFKLLLTGTNSEPQEESESVSVDVYVLLGAQFRRRNLAADELHRPVFISSVNIPTC